jgi:hypothetical protein
MHTSDTAIARCPSRRSVRPRRGRPPQPTPTGLCTGPGGARRGAARGAADAGVGRGHPLPPCLLPLPTPYRRVCSAAVPARPSPLALCRRCSVAGAYSPAASSSARPPLLGRHHHVSIAPPCRNALMSGQLRTGGARSGRIVPTQPPPLPLRRLFLFSAPTAYSSSPAVGRRWRAQRRIDALLPTASSSGAAARRGAAPGAADAGLDAAPGWTRGGQEEARTACSRRACLQQ